MSIGDASFIFEDWESGRVGSAFGHKIPGPSDRYSPGPTAWGKDPRRGNAIRASRTRRRMKSNSAQFIADVLPIIGGHFSPADWLALSRSIPENKMEFLSRGGFVVYGLGEKRAIVHPMLEPEKVEQCRAMGATVIG